MFTFHRFGTISMFDFSSDLKFMFVPNFRVYDNSRANAVMQKAITILSHEENLSKNKREKFRRYIHQVCGPEQDFYDDDNTTVGGEDLQKVTIQIKVCERTDESRSFLSFRIIATME